MKSYTYTELDELTGEVLPERAVLSTLLAADGGCQSNIVNPTGGGSGGGLLGALGIGANSGYSNYATASFVCTGAAAPAASGG
ncbi:MAG TPA: hypothetical protein VIL71_18035 [Spirillospora sp.]